MTRARNSANLASDGNLFVNISDDRTGIGSLSPTHKLHVAGTSFFDDDVLFRGANTGRNCSWDKSTRSLVFDGNNSVNGNYAKAQFSASGSYSMDVYNNLNNFVEVSPNVALFVKTCDLQVLGSGNRSGNIYDGAILRARQGIVELGHEISNGGATGYKLATTAYGVNVTGTTDTDGLIVSGVATVTTMNVTGVLTYDDVTSIDSIGIITARSNIDCNGNLDVAGTSNFTDSVTFSETLTLSKDTTDVINLSANSTSDKRGISFNSRTALSSDYNDGYLRLNNENEFTNGVYTPGLMRADGGIRVDANVPINSSGYLNASLISGALPAIDGSNLTGIDTDLVSDTSPQLGGNLDLNGNSILLDDDEKIFIGTSNDGSLFNSGSYLFLKNHNGSVAIQASSGGVISLQKYDNSDIGLQYVVDGKIQLNHDNVRALETDTAGINVYGATSSANGTVDIYPTGSAVYSILNLYNAAGNSNAQLIAVSGTTVYLGSGGTGSVNLRTGNSQNKVTCAHNGAVALYHSSSKKFETSSTGGSLTGVLSVSSNIRVSGEIDLGTANGNKFMDVCLGDNYAFYLRSTSGEGQNHENLMVLTRNQGIVLNYDANPRFETTSAGIDVTGTITMDAVPGTNTNAALPVLFQTSAGVIDGGSQLTYNPGGDVLKVNGLTLSSSQVRTSGNTALQLTTANANGTVDLIVRTTHVECNGNLLPATNNTDDLGSTSLRWRNVYTNDLNLSNEGKTNDVDGTWGSYTIQEGEDDLFLINKRSGKKYKFNLTEVS